MGVSVEAAMAPPALLPRKSSLVHLSNGAMELNLHHNHHHHHHHHRVSFATEEEAAAAAAAAAAREEKGGEGDNESEDSQRLGSAASKPLGSNEDGEEEDDDDEEAEEEDDDADFVLPRDIANWGLDERDARTADEWIHRHPDMVRLTGRHPFNAEPPLSSLMRQGFITPASLHYVRNHGPVPRAAWEEWRLTIDGLVSRPLSLAMDDLARNFPHRQLPVTLVCAGNRRKEQNMVNQSVGFNWGAAGVGTSVWCGVRLCDVLRAAAPLLRGRRRRAAATARFVCFEGRDSLPKNGGGGYGTCISIERAMDESQDVLLAFMQNGERLRPDHGFPLRLIVPGMIGGRMVKWLTRITLSDKPSSNYYHDHDNKVFPSHVDSEIASAEAWWSRPEYVINELNINSVITTPAHGEVLPINPGTMYTLGGYAYSGGGRMVTRVEVTLDDGTNWMACHITRPEKPTKYGKHWCWVFWQLEVEVVELLQAREIAVRAWDESMNTQPKELIWNLMGMMNNCWFRVKMHPCRGKLGGVALAFEHPTQPGNQSGGWMVKKKGAEEVGAGGGGAAGGLVKSASSPFLQAQRGSRAITMSEVRRHSKPESPWIVVHNHVYDCTSFLKEHPGGADSILINAGADCTEEFDAIHSSKAKALLEDFKIGELVVSSSGSSGSWSSADTSPEGSLHGGSRALAALSPIEEARSSRPVALANPRQAISCKLVKSEQLSHDLRRLRFALPSPDQVLGLATGKHVFVSATVNGKLCMRAYTPISSDDDEDCIGHFELLVRVYFPNVHPAFPAGGTMSQHFESLREGDVIGVKGPLGHIQYHGRGSFSISGERRRFSQLAMLAGGTGITPLYSLLKAMLRDSGDETKAWLIYANRRQEDIMLRDELDRWQQEHPERFRVWYVISDTPPSPAVWKFSTGYITEAIVRENLPPGGDAAAAFMCGPPAMIEFACLPNLSKHGYPKERCFQF